MKIAFLHTAQVHVETFDTLMQKTASDVQCQHHVAADLLERARDHGLSDVTAPTIQILQDLSQADAVICTCSTLGPIADQLSQSHPNVIRIDRPMMEAACTTGNNILVAICLESTKQATLDLLHDCASEAGQDITPRLVLCNSAWPHFEAGDMEQFAKTITRTISSEIEKSGRPDCILLAQASMRVAAVQLADLGLPVLSSPQLAIERAIAVPTLHLKSEVDVTKS